MKQGRGKGSVPAGQGNYNTVQYRETALLQTPIEASVLINRGILSMYVWEDRSHD